MAEVLSVAGKDLTLYFAQVLLGYAEVGGDDLGWHYAEYLFPTGIQLGLDHPLVGGVVKVGGQFILLVVSNPREIARACKQIKCDRPKLVNNSERSHESCKIIRGFSQACPRGLPLFAGCCRG